MEIRRFFKPTERYEFDTGLCSGANGFAQVDTRQDAPYFGTWVNPFSHVIVTYVEGDVTIEKHSNRWDFVQAVERLRAWNVSCGYGFGIDCGWTKNAIYDQFVGYGLGQYLH